MTTTTADRWTEYERWEDAARQDAAKRLQVGTDRVMVTEDGQAHIVGTTIMTGPGFTTTWWSVDPGRQTD